MSENENSLDTITREEFKLYNQVQEKQRVVDNLQSSLPGHYTVAGLMALMGIGNGYFAYAMTQAHDTKWAVFGAVGAISGVLALVDRLSKIGSSYLAQDEIEFEIDQIKATPPYRSLGLNE